WQETNDVAQLQQQVQADATEEAWTCRTSTVGTCAVGEDQGRPSLAPGTYYWVQTDAPEGYVTPGEQPVATAQITEAEAGTDLDPAQVTVAEASPEEDQAGKQAGEAGNEGTTTEDEESSNGVSDTEETAPVEDAEESAEADDPGGEGTEGSSDAEDADGEGAEGSSEADRPTAEPEGGATELSGPNQQTQGARLVAPDLAAVPMAQGPVQIGSLQARIANQISDGSRPCLTYAPEARGHRTAWVTNPDEARAGHSGQVRGGRHGDYSCPTRVNTRDQSVAGIRPPRSPASPRAPRSCWGRPLTTTTPLIPRPATTSTVT